MKVRQRDGTEERRIVTALIVNDVFLGRVASKWEDKLFKSKWGNLVAKWCTDYFAKYDHAPKGAIEEVYEAWSKKTQDEETGALVEKFLLTLSREYETLGEEIEPDFITDYANRYFDKVKLNRLKREIDEHLENDEVEKAQLLVDGFNKIQIRGHEGINVFEDKQVLREVFEYKQESIVDYGKGALGQFFGDQLSRDAFISFMGPEKRGKSWLLLDIAFQAMRTGSKVAYFQAGDLSRNQVLTRMYTRIAKHPKRARTVEEPKKIIIRNGEAQRVVTQSITFDRDLSWRIVSKSFARYKPLLKLSVHPNSTLSVGEIKSLLQTWERNGWKADVVVIDYADVLAPPPGVYETREKINENWTQMRSLSQMFNCLLVTATQTDADSYDRDLIKRKNFSDDKRKLAHVTGMIGINQTEEEKLMEVQRLNWIALREGEYYESKCVFIAGCRSLSRPAVISSWNSREK